MADAWQFTLERSFPSDTEIAREILDGFLASLHSAGWTEEVTFGLHLAVEEALMNAIKHGNQRDPEKTVLVEYQINGERMRIVIEDQGDGFDPNAVPDPTADENLELPSGRGLMLMRTFMTKVEYNAKGNRVLMEKGKDDPANFGDDD